MRLTAKAFFAPCTVLFTMLMFFLSMFVLFASDMEQSRRSDGTVVTFDRIKGIKTIKNDDGSVLTVDLNGKTPYGNAIGRDERIFYSDSKEGVSGILVFDPLKSDDLLQDEMLVLFDELYSALRISYAKKKPKQSLSVIISYCRFNEYGYCYKKQQSITAELIIEKKATVLASLAALDLKDKGKRDAFVASIISKRI